MGLAVVHGIVKNHAGAVTLRSEPGQGSVLELFLPVARKQKLKKKMRAHAEPPEGSERILFVDDEEMLLEMARGMLEGLGYQVTVAQNGAEAWNIFRENPSRFDLVITDQTMPGLTGVALSRKILKTSKRMPIILCTGYSEVVSADKARKAGISAFVMKPVVRKELAEVVRRTLDERKAVT